MLFISLLVFALLGSSSALEAAECSRDTCAQKLGKPCPPPNDIWSGERHHVSAAGGLDCECFCGLQEGEDCESDGQCDKGTVCMFETHIHPEHTQPACVSRCSLVQCNPDHTCIVRNGEPTCVPQSYKCSLTHLTPVIAIQQPQAGDEMKTKTFNNDCLRVMENKQLEEANAGYKWAFFMQ